MSHWPHPSNGTRKLSVLSRLFSKSSSSLPTEITPNTAEVPLAAWSIDVINSLLEDYAAIARPYDKNPVVAAAIEAMRRNAAKAVLQVGYYDDDGGFDPIDHPLTEIWKKPAPGETDITIIEHMYRSLLTSDSMGGNGFLQLVTDRDSTTGGTIRELQPIPCSWVRMPEMGSAIGQVARYNFTGTDMGRVYEFGLPPELVAHIKIGVSSMGRSFGCTPLDTQQAELALIKLVSVYETTILSRAGVPSFIIQLLGVGAQSLTREQIATMKADFSRAVSGRATADPFVTKGEMKIDTPGFSPKDLSVAELVEIAVARVCGVLGWAPMSLKQPDTGKTYSNLVEANKASWRDAVIPFLEQIAAALTVSLRQLPYGYGENIFPVNDKLAARFDTSQIEELAIDMDKMADRVTKLVGPGKPVIKVNEGRTMLGLAEIDESELEPQQDQQQNDQQGMSQQDENANG